MCLLYVGFEQQSRACFRAPTSVLFSFLVWPQMDCYPFEMSAPPPLKKNHAIIAENCWLLRVVVHYGRITGSFFLWFIAELLMAAANPLLPLLPFTTWLIELINNNVHSFDDKPALCSSSDSASGLSWRATAETHGWCECEREPSAQIDCVHTRLSFSRLYSHFPLILYSSAQQRVLLTCTFGL